MLQVRFAEVNRARADGAGLTFFANAQRFAGRDHDAAVLGADFDDDERRHGLHRLPQPVLLRHAARASARVLKALEPKGYFQSLAEPNLIAYNGQEASFLAGGEFPCRSSRAPPDAVSVDFKEFGVRLTFKPTIAGDVIRLR